MLNRTYFASPLAALALCITSQAAADVAPPATYVEECTLEKQTTASSECIACKAIRFGDGLGRCEKLLSPYCYKKACGAWGGTVYTEVWCRAKAENPLVVPQSIISQLNVYDAPIVDAGVGGAVNCPSPSTGTGGAPPVTTTPTQSTTPTQITITPPQLFEDEGWCSMSSATNASGKSSLGLLGLLGLMLVMNRRKARKS